MKDLEGGEDAGMSVDKAIGIARGWYPAPGLAGPRYRPAVLLLADEVERLRGIEQRATEWFVDTDLTHPSVSEAAIHDAMREVLDGEPEE